MYASPGVVVNDAKPLAHEILPGDVIEIPANDTLTLHPSGDQVKLEPRSLAVYTNQRQIELKYGTSLITTSSRVGVHVHQYMVTPVTQPAEYQVSWNNEGGRVWVRQGEITVDGCQKRLNITKDKIAELGRNCELGAYLRPGSSAWYAFGLSLPAAPPLCFELGCVDESPDGSKARFTKGPEFH